MKYFLIVSLIFLCGCSALSSIFWPIAEDVEQVVEKDIEKDVEKVF